MRNNTVDTCASDMVEGSVICMIVSIHDVYGSAFKDYPETYKPLILGENAHYISENDSIKVNGYDMVYPLWMFRRILTSRDYDINEVVNIRDTKQCLTITDIDHKKNTVELSYVSYSDQFLDQFLNDNGVSDNKTVVERYMSVDLISKI